MAFNRNGIGKRFICDFDAYRNLMEEYLDGDTYNIPKDINEFISENTIITSIIDRKNISGVSKIKIIDTANKPSVQLLSSSNSNLFNWESSIDLYGTDNNIFLILIRDYYSDTILNNFIIYYNYKVDNSNNVIYGTNITGFNYSDSSKTIIEQNIDSNSNRSININIYRYKVTDKIIKHYLNEKPLNIKESLPFDIGYKFFIDNNRKLGIDILNDKNIDSVNISFDYSVDNDGIVDIIENDNLSYSYLYANEENYIPIGSLIQLNTFNENINGSIKNNYLLCNGSVIPNKPVYYNLMKLLKPNVFVDVEKNKDFIYRPNDYKVIWILKNTSIKEFIEGSNFSIDINLEEVDCTIKERYWSGYSLGYKPGWDTNLLSYLRYNVGNITDRLVTSSNVISMLAGTNIFESGDYYSNYNYTGLTSKTFSINDKISVGTYRAPNSNSYYFTIYNDSRNEYLINGLSDTINPNGGKGFYYRSSYSSFLLIVNFSISNLQKNVLLGTSLSNTSCSITSASNNKYGEGIKPIVPVNLPSLSNNTYIKYK